ncbi:gnat family n-acetyltransferase [Holotrichia oblita]|uniref:Gnat family n-acetyltransferase n=2 Tax=Holotrichia oblita TaxID=644536 RepID=A0ACB9SP46_HOLOL|nr:gnat family n-acetyltransferase [Holotrichia oblita]KAI4456895.1 gnat family n-acetyltransferase [Holotrichia oblita]
MTNFIVIRQSRTSDIAAINQVVRDAYLSNIFPAWCNALTKEITFQLVIVSAAILFIFMGVPLQYCFLAIPVVMLLLLVIVASAFLMKATELSYGKKPIQCWVAEAFEPYFSMEKPESQSYEIIPEYKIVADSIDLTKCKKRIVGTVSVARFINVDNAAWLFRLAVNKRYQRKGVAHSMVRTVQTWCKDNRYYDLMLAVSECQDNARKLFMNTGFV